MGFELFDQKYFAPEQAPELTIRKNGTFALSKAAFQLIGNAQHIQLFFDPDKRLVGIKPCKEDDVAAYSLHSKELESKKRANPTVAVKAFCRINNINTDRPRVYDLSYEEGMLIADLNSEWRVPRSAIKEKSVNSPEKKEVNFSSRVIRRKEPEPLRRSTANPSTPYPSCTSGERCAGFEDDFGPNEVPAQGMFCHDCKVRAGVA